MKATSHEDTKFAHRKFLHLERMARHRLKAAEFRVGIAILSFTREKTGGVCRGSLADLAAKIGVSRDTVRRSLAALEKAKLFKIDQSKGGRASVIVMVEADDLTAANRSNMMQRLEDDKTDVEPLHDDATVTVATCCNPNTVTVSAGRPSGAGPASHSPVEVADNNSRGSSTGTFPSEASVLGDAPAAVPWGTAGAPVASDEEEDWSFFGEVETEDTALSIYRGENNGWMPTRTELEAFAEERGLPITDGDLEDVAENEALLAQDEEDILADLRAGRIQDRFGEIMTVPESDGMATTMLRTPRRRAAYVAEACRMAEERRPSDRLTFWQHRCIEITNALNAEAADAETIQILSLLHAEFTTELRRRTAITRDQIERVRA